MMSTIVNKLHVMGVQKIAQRAPCKNLPLAGRSSHFIHNWEVIMIDEWVLNIIKRYE